MLDGAKKHFVFGYMRLPMNGDEVDIEQTKQMVDYFLENGFNYFDTAHGYLEGKSEKAIKTCLADRHKRDEFILTNKLTNFYFKKEEDIRPLFEQQLEACGVEYFDYYLMHAQSAEIFKYFKERHAYETAFALKEEGKIKHVGISFHDRAEVLDEDPAVQSKKCYEVWRKHNKPVLVMEPVKGGSLVNLPEEAKKFLRIFTAEVLQAMPSVLRPDSRELRWFFPV